MGGVPVLVWFGAGWAARKDPQEPGGLPAPAESEARRPLPCPARPRPALPGAAPPGAPGAGPPPSPGASSPPPPLPQPPRPGVAHVLLPHESARVQKQQVGNAGSRARVSRAGAAVAIGAARCAPFLRCGLRPRRGRRAGTRGPLACAPPRLVLKALQFALSARAFGGEEGTYLHSTERFVPDTGG